MIDTIKGYFLVAFILVIVSYLSPRESYMKYMKFFVGVLMTIMVIKPVIRIVNIEPDYLYVEGWDALINRLEAIDFDIGGEDWFEGYLTEAIEEN